MKSLAAVLPLVLSEFVSSVESPQYANFLLILRISVSLECDSYSDKQLRSLSSDISLYLSNYVSLHRKPERCTLTPKHHALLHLPAQIKMFGPPRYSWCFRYEAKNARMKKVMQRNCNYHNIPYTLSAHTQKLMGLDVKLQGEGTYFEGTVNFNSIKFQHELAISVQDTPWSQLLISRYFLEPTHGLRKIETLKISGRICSQGSFFVRSLPGNEILPCFFKIAECYLSNDRVLLILEECETCFFLEDRFSFIVNPLKTFVAVDVEHLLYPIPLHSFFYDGEWHIIPNYYHLL